VQVLARIQRPEGVPRGEILLLHGLEGSSEGGYMRSMAQASLEAGYIVQRLNLRSCGGTESLANTLYHAGLTSDLRAILEQLRIAGRTPVWLAGYSLGGNTALKLAGELGSTAREYLHGVCAVSAPVDLAASARALSRPANRLYEWRFVRCMKERMRERHRFNPQRFPLDSLDSIRTLYEFDDRVTAPFFGFHGAAHYYETQSAIHFLDAIRIPTLLLTAKDDPLVPYEIFRHPSIAANPHLELQPSEYGGHLGFIAGMPPVFWLDGALLAWIERKREQLG
jgi:uncharacterized protein